MSQAQTEYLNALIALDRSNRASKESIDHRADQLLSASHETRVEIALRIIRAHIANIDNAEFCQVFDPQQKWTYKTIKHPFQSEQSLLDSDTKRDTEELFSVFQWNILSDISSGAIPSLGGFEQLSEPTDKWLKWAERRWRLMEKIYESRADIVALVEVDHFKEFFQPALEFVGYTCLYKHKPEPTIEGSKERDGALLAFKTSKFQPISVKFVNLLREEPKGQDLITKGVTTCSYPSLSAVDTNIEANQSEGEESKDDSFSNQVAIVAKVRLFRSKQELQSEMHAYNSEEDNNGFEILLAVTHLKAGKEQDSESIRHAQVRHLIPIIEAMRQCENSPSKLPALVMGDFNSVTKIGAESTTHGSLKNESPFEPLSLSEFKNVGFQNVIDMITIGGDGKRRNVVTTSKQRKGVFTASAIDNIFWSDSTPNNTTSHSLNLVRCGVALEPKDAAPTTSCLPHPLWPSDHIALEAIFRMH